MDAAADCEPKPRSRPRDGCADLHGRARRTGAPTPMDAVTDWISVGRQLPRARPRVVLRRPPWVRTGQISAGPMDDDVGRRRREEVGCGRGRGRVIAGHLGHGWSPAAYRYKFPLPLRGRREENSMAARESRPLAPSPDESWEKGLPLLTQNPHPAPSTQQAEQSWLHTRADSKACQSIFLKLTKDKAVKCQSLELAGWYQTVPYLRPESHVR
jgi:hypothetical protein